jgi:hypothetical protein
VPQAGPVAQAQQALQEILAQLALKVLLDKRDKQAIKVQQVLLVIKELQVLDQLVLLVPGLLVLQDHRAQLVLLVLKDIKVLLV